MDRTTPGPWKVVENKRERTVQIDTQTGTVVQPGAISWIPDARLIAAAPRMLAFIHQVENFWPDKVKVHPDVKILLAKARTILRDVEGESNG